VHVSNAIADSAVGLVAGIHVLISGAEIFLWKTLYPRLEQFDFSSSEAEKAGPIVANAGLYNGFIAAGLLWSLLSSTNPQGVRFFFLTCVMVAGVFGAATLKTPKTLGLQTLPALVAMLLVWIAGA
jgi:putative membrane protein